MSYRTIMFGVLACGLLGAATCAATPPSSTAGIAQHAGAWWGDPNTPNVNQVWVDVANATPDKNLTSPYTYRWSCRLPKYAGAGQTLALDYTVIQVNSTDVHVVGHPNAGTQYSWTIDPAKYAAAGDEIRIRCVAHETTGPNVGHQTGVTAGFPIRMQGGSGGDVWQHHNQTGYLDAHGWYDRGVEYDYAIFDNAVDLTSRTLSGTVNVRMHGFRRFGDTVQAHHRVQVDGKTIAEFHDSNETRTIALDTRKLTDGLHTLAVHSHALETGASEQPGKQIAGEVQVTIRVQNS